MHVSPNDWLDETKTRREDKALTHRFGLFKSKKKHLRFYSCDWFESNWDITAESNQIDKGRGRRSMCERTNVMRLFLFNRCPTHLIQSNPMNECSLDLTWTNYFFTSPPLPLPPIWSSSLIEKQPAMATFLQRLSSAFFYASCSGLITIVNKLVLTSYG